VVYRQTGYFGRVHLKIRVFNAFPQMSADVSEPNWRRRLFWLIAGIVVAFVLISVYLSSSQLMS
jgi:hypothetical protein